MYEEELIFGPLTWRQFVYAASGAGVALISFLHVPGYAGIFIALVSLGLGAKFTYENKPKKIEIENMETYLQEKKITLGDAKFKSWLKTIIAEKTSYFLIRSEKGLDTDFELELALGILKETFKKEVSK